MTYDEVQAIIAKQNAVKPLSVAVLVPSMTWMHAETAVNLARACAYMAAAGIPGELFGVQCSSICEARNRLLDDCLPYEPSHVLWLDSDMVFPREIVAALLAHDKDIVGCMYSTRVKPYRMVGQLLDDSRVHEKGLQRARYLPGGCVLVKSDVYRKIPAPWFEDMYNLPGASEKNKYGFISEDVIISDKVLDAGYEIWADLDLSEEIGHIGHSTLKLNFKQDEGGNGFDSKW
jgi:hypothetical protein